MFYYGNGCMEIQRKSNRRIIVYLTIFLITIVFGSFVSMAAKPNENIAQKAVESFLKQLAEHRITRIEVYYRTFYLLTEGPAATENVLRDYCYGYKVIAMDPNLAEVAKSLREFKFEKSDWGTPDFRWGCVFYADNENKEALRLFFPPAPVVAVNGIEYKATPELIRSLMQFLPVEAYKEMNEFIENWWKQWPDFQKQLEAPHEQKKSDKP